MQAIVMLRLAYVVLLVGTAIEAFLIVFYLFLLVFYISDIRERAQIKQDLIAAVVSFMVLLTIWATSGGIVDYILGT